MFPELLKNEIVCVTVSAPDHGLSACNPTKFHLSPSCQCCQVHVPCSGSPSPSLQRIPLQWLKSRGKVGGSEVLFDYVIRVAEAGTSWLWFQVQVLLLEWLPVLSMVISTQPRTPSTGWELTQSGAVTSFSSSSSCSSPSWKTKAILQPQTTTRPRWHSYTRYVMTKCLLFSNSIKINRTYNGALLFLQNLCKHYITNS